MGLIQSMGCIRTKCILIPKQKSSLVRFREGIKMNVRKFKEIIREQNYNEENFRIFRAWENNCYDNYQKNMRIAYYNAKEMYVKEEDFLASDENSVMEYQWKYIGYDSMVELHNLIGCQIY